MDPLASVTRSKWRLSLLKLHNRWCDSSSYVDHSCFLWTNSVKCFNHTSSESAQKTGSVLSHYFVLSQVGVPLCWWVTSPPCNCERPLLPSSVKRVHGHVRRQHGWDLKAPKKKKKLRKKGQIWIFFFWGGGYLIFCHTGFIFPLHLWVLLCIVQQLFYFVHIVHFKHLLFLNKLQKAHSVLVTLLLTAVFNVNLNQIPHTQKKK